MPATEKTKKGSLRVTEELLDVNAKYLIDEKEIGHGHYGVVRRCTNRVTGEPFAIKTIRKAKVNRIELLKREIEILRTVNHPTIIKLYDVYEDENNLHLITELCTGGELFDRIIAKTESEEGHYSERDAARVVHKILTAIEYCHNEHNIAHRDLKPENFIFKSKDSEDDLKIIDFGLSRFENEGTHMQTRVGTPYYISPEVLEKKYDRACDLWSIGVITYILLCGYPPFYGEADHEIFKAIQRGQFKFLSPEWDTISDEAKDLIRSLLHKDATQRITASRALVHPWFERVLDRSVADTNLRINTNRINHRLRRFVGTNKMKKTCLHIIAQNVAEEDIGHLRKIFNSIDVDGNGEITLEELQQVIAQEGLVNLQADVLELIRGIDMNGNQTIDYNEFIAATMEKAVFTRENYMRKAFEHFDYSNKGHISVEDLMKVFQDEQNARKILAEIDSNGDGVISYEEFKYMMNRL